ncbi:MAG: hypothetical protein J6T36_02290, partial [Campylobacter sp.]|nr:hypothetical protein [Campylobacter sp.]
MKNFEVEYIAGGKKQKMFLKADNKVAARNLIKQRNGGVITKIGETQTSNVSASLGDIKTQVTRLMGASSRVRIPALVASVKQLSGKLGEKLRTIKGNMVNLPGQEATLLLWEIGNIELLLWCAVGKDGMCAIGNFFDRSIRIAYKISEDETINVSPYSYLQLDKLWEKVDNVDFDNIIASAEEAARQHEYCYMMSNYDVLAMITAADALEKTDLERSKKLLEEALKLDEWLIGKEPKDEMRPLHIINKMQIMKRQRELTAD